MALPICLEIPEIPDPLSITLPGGVTMQQINLMQAIQPALTPLMPLFDIIDTVVAVFNCVKAIPDSLGPPPDPTALAACIPELAEKVAKLLRLIPQLSLPYTIIGIIDLVIDTLRQARSQLMHLQQQMQQILGAIDRATELEDAGLMAITSCAQANVAQEAANVDIDATFEAVARYAEGGERKPLHGLQQLVLYADSLAHVDAGGFRRRLADRLASLLTAPDATPADVAHAEKMARIKAARDRMMAGKTAQKPSQ